MTEENSKIRKLEYDNSETIAIAESCLKLAKEGRLRQVAIFGTGPGGESVTLQNSYKDQRDILITLICGFCTQLGLAWLTDVYEDPEAI